MKMKVLKTMLFISVIISLFVILPITASAKVIDSGECGDNLTWTLDNDGTLTIDGTGDMWDYIPDSWHDSGIFVKTVIIKDGVTSIGYAAFSEYEFGYHSLKSVIIGNGVKTIGINAFSWCMDLENLTIGNSVTTIEDGAFYCCGASLTNLIIPDSVETIGRGTFEMCGSLTNVILGESLTSIGNGAFSYCSSLEEIIIPDSVTTIEDDAFYYCYSLKEVKIGDSVTTIEDDAFNNCSSLTSITVDTDNSSYSSDDNGVLFDKNKTLLILYPAGNPNTSYEIPNGVETIGQEAFEYCENLTTVTIPNSIKSIERWAFSNCDNLKNAYYSGTEDQFNSITIGDYNDKLTNADIYFPCGENTFWSLNDEGTLTITGAGEMYDWYTYNNTPWYKHKNSIYKIYIDKNVTNIRALAFHNYENLTDVTIGYGVTEIEDEAFSYCTNLANVTGGKSLKAIGSGAFSGCSSLKDITLPSGLKSIGYGAFMDCSSITNVAIPDSVTSLGAYAYSNCSGITNLTIGNGITEIFENTFEGCTGLDKVTIPDSVTTLWENAFMDCRYLTGVTIGDSVTEIGNSAFSNCENLKEISIPASVTVIKYEAFSDCEGLEKVCYYGTYSEWNEIEIEENNEVLAKALMCKDYKPMYITIDGQNIDISSGSLTGDISLDVFSVADSTQVKLIVAVYDEDDNYVGMTSKPVTINNGANDVDVDLSVSLSKNVQNGKIKVFIWKGLTDLAPLSVSRGFGF